MSVTTNINKKLMELIRTLVDKCIDEHTYIVSDEVSLERENKQHYKIDNKKYRFAMVKPDKGCEEYWKNYDNRNQMSPDNPVGDGDL